MTLRTPCSDLHSPAAIVSRRADLFEIAARFEVTNMHIARSCGSDVVSASARSLELFVVPLLIPSPAGEPLYVPTPLSDT